MEFNAQPWQLKIPQHRAQFMGGVVLRRGISNASWFHQTKCKSSCGPLICLAHPWRQVPLAETPFAIRLDLIFLPHCENTRIACSFNSEGGTLSFIFFAEGLLNKTHLSYSQSRKDYELMVEVNGYTWYRMVSRLNARRKLDASADYSRRPSACVSY